jgi:probable rRNA maturation factor
MIDFNFLECKTFKFSKTLLKNNIKCLIENEGFKCGDISVVFCSDVYLLSLNIKHLNHDFFTDIITFDYSIENKIKGDLFISVDRLYENSLHFNVDFLNEMNRVVYHGVLHLCKFKDKTKSEKEIMTKKENHYLNLFS